MLNSSRALQHTLIDEHQPGRVKHALFSHPASSRPRHVRTLLLRRAQAFFKRDLVALKEAPHRGATTRKLALAHRTDDLVQRQIRLHLNQRQQKVRVLLQW